MPHSGGGGSHSGGSSGGHSSGGGSHSGGSSYRSSSTPFTGSSTYIVYNNAHGPRIIYSDNPHYREGMNKYDYIGTMIAGCLFMIPGIIALIVALATLFSAFSIGYTKTKLPDFVDKNIVIEDESRHLARNEKENFSKTLTKFLDKTGIIPSVEFVDDADWVEDYGLNNMENFAYNEYVTKFSDEYHLLIVYSYSDINQKTGFTEYYYHTMWGDNLGKTAKEKDEKKLLKLLERNLAIANGKNVGSAVDTTFDEYLDYFESKTISVDTSLLFGSIGCFVWGLAFAGAGFSITRGAKQQYLDSQTQNIKTYKINGKPTMKKCEYCGRSYVVDENGIPCETTCRGCGAPLT